MIAAILTLACIYIGIGFILISAIGIIRMPDVYTRMSAATKAVTLGIGFILLGVIIHFNDTSVFIKVTVILFFLLFSLSVAAHVIGLAAYKDKTKLSDLTFLDELKNYIAKEDALKKVADPDQTMKDADHTKGQ